jgi:hypothetical protein
MTFVALGIVTPPRECHHTLSATMPAATRHNVTLVEMTQIFVLFDIWTFKCETTPGRTPYTDLTP